ncbi:N-acetyltransferase GCN5 [Clostridium bornimense]|uniref:N-acetyltransferase GCN5 n=1 Tax=Clostridium bornimense TaxID=1216932 RepID=W6SCA8_9CLOT|nr:GNAT family N-acetyltransferase [Clostridium bornimense]CDM67260.1 N-acetyltransferase GCN5 [Clostridium bornimense]
MEFRKAIKSDLDNIMIIIKEAQKYFKENNIDQWQDNYPNEKTILNDVNNETSYVLVKDDNIVATASISFEAEPTYNHIEGNWLTNDRYVVIHRVAVSNDYKGLRLSSTILDNAKALALKNNIHSIKIDTHKDNKAMQKVLLKNNFTYCGIIYLEDNSERIAFEKTF